MIDSVGGVQVLSSFQRVTNSNGTSAVTHIQYVETNGAIAVKEIVYTTYNAQAKEVAASSEIGSKVDIKI
jgi:hypothetical protein